MNLLSGFRWSYSKLDVACSCPFAFKKIYLDHCKEAENPFAQVGTLCHDLLAQYELGKLASYDLLPLFAKRAQKEVTAEWPVFPLDLADRTFAKISAYFRRFSGFKFRRILLVEEKIVGTVSGRPFSGVLDLVAEDEQGRIVIVDHKSSGMSEYRGRRLRHHARQLFLYAHLLRQRFLLETDAVVFNLFKEGEWIEIPWTKAAEEEAISWATGIMAAVEGLVSCYFGKLPEPAQRIQELLIGGKSTTTIKKTLHLSARRMRRYLLEMDELAQLVCGMKEPSGDYGCRNICSARLHCDEGGDP